MEYLLKTVLGVLIGLVIAENAGWFILKMYYTKRHSDRTIVTIKTDSLLVYSHAIIKLDKQGYKILFDKKMLFNLNNYRAILIKKEDKLKQT